MKEVSINFLSLLKLKIRELIRSMHMLTWWHLEIRKGMCSRMRIRETKVKLKVTVNMCHWEMEAREERVKLRRLLICQGYRWSPYFPITQSTLFKVSISVPFKKLETRKFIYSASTTPFTQKIRTIWSWWIKFAW